MYNTRVPISSMAPLQQQPHVPKFGNWDSDNTPYTIYFENARLGKNGVKENPEAFFVGRGKIMNPNDPEDNPGLGRGVLRSDGSYDNHLVASPVRKPPLDPKHQHRLRHSNIGTNTYDDGPESADWSSTSSFSSGAPHNHKTHIQKAASVPKFRTWDKKDPTSGQTHIQKAVSVPKFGTWDKKDPTSGQTHIQKAASVPKFGTWDENDPTSGDGFTFIFDKVKEEKHNASANFPTPPQHITHYNNQQKHGAASSRYKICCCIF